MSLMPHSPLSQSLLSPSPPSLLSPSRLSSLSIQQRALWKEICSSSIWLGLPCAVLGPDWPARAAWPCLSPHWSYRAGSPETDGPSAGCSLIQETTVTEWSPNHLIVYFMKHVMDNVKLLFWYLVYVVQISAGSPKMIAIFVSVQAVPRDKRGAVMVLTGPWV